MPSPRSATACFRRVPRSGHRSRPRCARRHCPTDAVRAAPKRSGASRCRHRPDWGGGRTAGKSRTGRQPSRTDRRGSETATPYGSAASSSRLWRGGCSSGKTAGPWAEAGYLAASVRLGRVAPPRCRVGAALCAAARSPASLASRSARKRTVFAASAARVSSTRAAASADSAFTPDCTRGPRRPRLSPAIPPDWPIAAANRCAVANCQRQWRRRRNRRDAIWFRLLWFLRFSVGPSFLCRHRRLLLPRINSGTPDECPWPDPAFSGASWGLSPAQSGTVKRMFNWSVDGPYHQFCNPLCKKIRNKSGMRFALMF
jgi:hypothetical protein